MNLFLLWLPFPLLLVPLAIGYGLLVETVGC
jgi:hypothetical protein